MQFKEALRQAGLRNPGRTTWSGVAPDGTLVFTIWDDLIRQIDGRSYAWWDHNESRVLGASGTTPSPGGMARARAFIRRAQKAMATRRRYPVVIVHAKKAGGVESAEYPHKRWAWVEFRAADLGSRQFIAELFPPD
jgi:hypothetical protein